MSSPSASVVQSSLVPTQQAPRSCAGAVPGFDMTCEAALTKLAVLLGQDLDSSTAAELMQRDVAGELTSAQAAGSSP